MLANLFLGALLRNSCLVTSFGNLFLETCSWEPVLGNLSLETLHGNLAWEPALGNLFLGTFVKFGHLFLVLGNLG